MQAQYPRRRRSVRFPAVAAVLMALVGCTDPAGSEPPAATSPPAAPAPAEPVPSAVTPSDPAASSPTPSADDAALLNNQAVAAAHPAAVDAGMQVLAAGGNAADAAVATAFAVAVVEPFASGIGGGGAAVLASAGLQPTSYDYREVVAQGGTIPKTGTGIPGFVAGMAAIHENHGKLGWNELLAPAIALAEGGFAVSDFLALRMKSDYGPAALRGLPQFTAPGQALPLGAGDRLVQTELAQTMKVLAAEGPKAFYSGSLAAELARIEGIDAASLAAYEVQRTEPVRGTFGPYSVVSAAPPLPGTALIQMLQVAEALGIQAADPRSGEYVDRLSTAWTVAENGVRTFLGDPRFVEVPTGALTDPAANSRLAEQARQAQGPAAAAGGAPDRAADDAADGSGAAADLAAAGSIVPGNTTHLTVIDSSGLTVSMTNTITSFWGANAGSVGGYFLNNQLSRFESLDTPSNQPQPGRKSVSWSAPSLVLDSQGRVVLGIGSPGGHQIPNILSNVLIRWGLQGAPLQEAVDSPRYHLQEGVLALEEQPGASLQGLIRTRGWEQKPTSREEAVFGSVQALEIDYGTRTISGAVDTRREARFAVSGP